MVEMILSLLFLLGIAGLILRHRYKIRKRKPFTAATRKLISEKQKTRCKDCKRYLSKFTIEFHHKDGNRSNNKPSNCVALCSNCHAKKTRTRNQNKPFKWW